MGDRVSVSLAIGGAMPARLVAEFVELCETEGLQIDWCDDVTVNDVRAWAAVGEAPILGAHEVNYGNLGELEPWLQEHALPYRLEWDQGGGFGAGGRLFDGADVLEYPQSDGAACISAADILRDPAAALELARKLVVPLPPFGIVARKRAAKAERVASNG